MSNKKKSPPWEDALILALRDLQWIVKQQKVVEHLNEIWSSLDKRDVKKSELTQAFQMETQSSVTCPPLLAKLDGAAESASGDVITSVERKFFLFEFKSGKAALKDEKGKFVLELLNKIPPKTFSEKLFLSLSRRGHHVLYPDVSYDKDGVGSESALKGFLPLHKVTLQTRRYFDALVADERLNQSSKWYTAEEIPAKELMWGNRDSAGLDVAEMAVYLETLSKVHQGGEHAHPMKVVIASPDGFLWPGGDLADLLAMAKYFDDSLSDTSEMKTKLNGLRGKFLEIISQHKPSSESSSADTIGCGGMTPN